MGVRWRVKDPAGPWIPSSSGANLTSAQTSARSAPIPPWACSGCDALTPGVEYEVHAVWSRAAADGGGHTGWVPVGAVTLPKPTVNISVSPNTLIEQNYAGLTARLSWALPSDVEIPLTVTAGSAETGDYNTVVNSVTIAAGSVEGTIDAYLLTNTDADEDDETLTVALGTLPSSVVAGGMSSVQVTIRDKDFTTPAPTGLRVTPGNRRLTLSWTAPAPLKAGDSVFAYGYEVGYKCGESKWFDHGGTPLSRQTTRVIDGLSPGNAHEVRVRASVFLFRAVDGTSHTLMSDWIYGTGTPSGARSSTATYCGGGAGASGQQESGAGGGTVQQEDGGDGDGGVLEWVGGAEGAAGVNSNSALIDQMREWRNDPQWVHAKDHTDRWDRALLALGESVSDGTLTAMTAAEAQGFADRGWERWEEVAEALRQLETGGATDNAPAQDNTPPQPAQDPPPPLHATLIGQMYDWRNNNAQWSSNKSHTDRWDRALLAFGEAVLGGSLTPMTAAEAQAFADRGWTPWVEVAQALKAVVTGTGSPDTLTGTSAGELLVGLDGADALRGLGGNDELRGGSGNDDLTGGAGRDRFVFFSGQLGAKEITDFASGDVIVLKGDGWSSVADIIAGVQAVGSTGYRYTLAFGLTVETTNNRTLRTEDFVTD